MCCRKQRLHRYRFLDELHEILGNQVWQLLESDELQWLIKRLPRSNQSGEVSVLGGGMGTSEDGFWGVGVVGWRERGRAGGAVWRGGARRRERGRGGGVVWRGGIQAEKRGRGAVGEGEGWARERGRVRAVWCGEAGLGGGRGDGHGREGEGRNGEGEGRGGGRGEK
ncbi:hypothetical protein Fmac_009237 [Flemingia macrophylla]|uniref:Uncharacterized protein n=1 Tax=Flemingia macrophylla TaxID=520843 RepID=A0ABD1N0H6_9FABA